jgi:hypothetical protein
VAPASAQRRRRCAAARRTVANGGPSKKVKSGLSADSRSDVPNASRDFHSASTRSSCAEKLTRSGSTPSVAAMVSQSKHT